jgi:hypothetical protein
MKLGMYIMAPERISTAHFINTSHHSVCLYFYVAMQLLGKNVTAPTNTRNITVNPRYNKLIRVIFCYRRYLV